MKPASIPSKRASRLRRILGLAGVTVILGTGLYVFLNHPTPPDSPGVPLATTANKPTALAALASGTNSPIQPDSRSSAPAFNKFANPYAAALREPGKSKRNWETDFLTRFRQAADGDPIRFELTEGGMAVGTIKITQRRDGELSYISGELTEPEPGKFFFLTPPAGGKAGKAVGVVEFPASKTAYRIEPTGPNGDPELWQRRLDEVICVDMPVKTAAASVTNETAEMPPLRPDAGTGLVPSYNSNIVSLQSYPGSPAVLLLDFFGGYTPTWGGQTYSRPTNVNNSTIKDLWKRVAEDYQPFNINVTTDLKVYEAAPASSRQRCCFTDTPITPAGVAYFGSWNWGNDTPCWSVYTSGKSGAEVGAHEPGHTLGLSHQGQGDSTGTTNEYYGGQGSGATGWAPIMGVGYYQPVATWAKGEFQYANNTQDELAVIVSQNNNVGYRPDDTGSTLATSRYLEIYPDFAAMAEGVIETTDDTDAFQFTTTGGKVALTANPVPDWANLAVMVTLADATDTIIASNNPQTTLSATIITNLPAGTYTFRVTGAGRNNPLTTGFTSYGSLGYYAIVGSVAGAQLPTRLSVFEHVPDGTVVGTVPASSPGDPLSYAIVSGNTSNTFTIDASGIVTVANSAALDYQRIATNTMLAVQYELFVNITNLNDANLTELNRRVIVSVLRSDLNYPIAVSGFNAGVIAPFNATTALPKATGFDIPNNFCFYQAGLNMNPQVSVGGGGQGLPANGTVLSQVDGTTFQLGPYGGTNALLLGNTYPRYGTLTLTTPRPYNSLAILASSANGGGVGTLVLNFTNGTKSQVFSLNAQDWYGTITNVAAQGIGRLRLGQATLTTENPGWNNPNLYQTTLNLAALGINQSIASITFTNPNTGGSMDTGIFAVSGAVMPPDVNITVQPLSVTNNLPAQNATFTAKAMGTPPLYWQWYFSTNGSADTFAPLSGKTSSNLVLNAVLQSSNAGSYLVVVTNSSSAATSSVATLTLYREPVITRQPSPTNLFLFAGKSTALSVAANAALPVNYHLNLNASPVTSGTSSNFALNNLQAGNSGNYTIVVSNAFGMATSSIVSLTVLASPTNYPYAQAVLASQPLGYWRLNETGGTIAHDYAGGRNGTYIGVTLNQTGYNPADPDKAARFGPGINSYVGKIPVDFATNGNAVFTVEAWVKGSAQTTDAGIITKGAGAGGEQFNLDTGAGGHAFRFFVRDAGGTACLANGNLAPNGNWQHIVGVCNQTAGQVILYVNGVSNASATITAGGGLKSSANDTAIGSRQSGTAAYDNQFVGTIDEVAIYSYAMTAAQVQTHYAVRTNVPPVFPVNPFTKSDVVAGQIYSGTIAGNATDPNADALTFAKVSGPSWLAVAGNGALSGTPVSADTGTNSFVVKATDPAGLFATATMYLGVTPATPITMTVSFDGTTLMLNWAGGVAPYEVQTTTNLINPIWEPLGSPTSDTSLTVSPTNAAAFYRILGQ